MSARLLPSGPVDPRVRSSQVVLVKPVTSLEQLRAETSKARAITVNGANVLRWARWIANERTLQLPSGGAGGSAARLYTFDAAAEAEYVGLNGVPDVVLLSAVYPDSDECCAALKEALGRDREGCSKSHYGSAEHAAAGDAASTEGVAEFDDGIDEYENAVRSPRRPAPPAASAGGKTILLAGVRVADLASPVRGRCRRTPPHRSALTTFRASCLPKSRRSPSSSGRAHASSLRQAAQSSVTTTQTGSATCTRGPSHTGQASRRLPAALSCAVRVRTYTPLLSPLSRLGWTY